MTKQNKNRQNKTKTNGKTDTAESEFEKQDALDSDSYHFMNEVIKKKPINRKLWIRRILITAAFSIGAGLLAAVVFVLFVPTANRWLNRSTETAEKIVMSSSESSEDASSVSGSAENQKEEDGDGQETDDADNAESDEGNSTKSESTDKQEESGDSQAEAGIITLEQYKAIYREMLDQTEEVKKSTVEVAGISSEMDYFNQSVENQKQVSGQLIAKSESSIYVLTQYSAVTDADEICITFCDDSTVSAEYLCHDSNTDLAILSVSRSELSDTTWNSIAITPLGNSYSTRQGDPVIAVGSPMGYSDSVECGIITSVDHSVQLWDSQYPLFMTDMIGSSSGSGVLVNLDGKVIGIIAQQFSDENQNMVTALPISQIRSLIEHLTNDEAGVRIGLKGQTVTSDLMKTTGVPVGMLVTEVDSESPAMYAGIKEYDVITSVDDQDIYTFDQYVGILSDLKADMPITVKAMRKGKDGYSEIEFSVTPEQK